MDVLSTEISTLSDKVDKNIGDVSQTIDTKVQELSNIITANMDDLNERIEDIYGRAIHRYGDL